MIRRIISLQFLDPLRDDTVLADIAWFIRKTLCSIPFVLSTSVGLSSHTNVSDAWDMIVFVDLSSADKAHALPAHPEYRALFHGYLHPKINAINIHDFTFVEEYSPLEDG